MGRTYTSNEWDVQLAHRHAPLFLLFTDIKTHPFLFKDIPSLCTENETHPFLLTDTPSHFTDSETHPFLFTDTISLFTDSETHPFCTPPRRHNHVISREETPVPFT